MARKAEVLKTVTFEAWWWWCLLFCLVWLFWFGFFVLFCKGGLFVCLVFYNYPNYKCKPKLFVLNFIYFSFSPTAGGQCNPFCQCKFVRGLCEDFDRKGSEEGIPSGQELHWRQTEAGGWKWKTGQFLCLPSFFLCFSCEMTVVVWTSGEDTGDNSVLGHTCGSTMREGCCCPPLASALSPQCMHTFHLQHTQKMQADPTAAVSSRAKFRHFRAEATSTSIPVHGVFGWG